MAPARRAPAGTSRSAATKRELGAHRHLAVERGPLGRVADQAARRERRRGEVVPVDERLARGRREDARQHAERRRLAGAVRAEEPDHLAARDVEGDVVDGGASAEALGEVPGLDHPTASRAAARARSSRAPAARSGSAAGSPSSTPGRAPGRRRC